jgi:hypothetical protein
LILLNFQDFKFLESKTAHAHLLYNFFSKNKLRSFFPFCLRIKSFQLSTLHRIQIRICRSSSSILLAVRDTVTSSSNCRRCVPPICIVDSVTVHCQLVTPQITTNLLPCPKEESPMEIHNHRGHH